MQVSKAGKMRFHRDPRFVPAIALVFWAIGAVVFALLPPESSGRNLTADSVHLASSVFSLASVWYVVSGARGRERLFWGLLGAGLFAAFLADMSWNSFQGADFVNQALSLAHVAYLVSYLLLGGALLCLVAATTRRITTVITFDALAVMLSVGVLVWYFLMEGGPGSWAVLATFSWPLFDAALVFMGLVVFSAAGRSPFVGLLIMGFLAFAVADTWYLGARSSDLYRVVGWPDLFWSLGLVLLGSAALRSDSADFTAQERIAPWRVFVFWLGPLSPPLQLGLLFLWGAFHPPLPAYVLAGGAALLAYLALRVALVSAVTRQLSRDEEVAARRLEQSRVLYELHDTVKGRVHGTSLTLNAALEAERRGDRDAAREGFGRAMEASRETEFLISKPYDELQAMANESIPRPGDFLRHRLKKFEGYFGIHTHDDLQAPLESLSPAEIAAVIRVAVEAFWNVAKHSGARNMYLESRRVGPTLIVRIRDDGRGFDAEDPPPGMGLGYLRQRSAEVGAELDVISSPGRGATVQLRFE
ncbi:MAG: sensor histidine kinase [Rubrobacteraceae bacterium]|nr:hypothetical protein [Rubrobacter sp.]